MSINLPLAWLLTIGNVPPLTPMVSVSTGIGPMILGVLLLMSIAFIVADCVSEAQVSRAHSRKPRPQVRPLPTIPSRRRMWATAQH